MRKAPCITRQDDCKRPTHSPGGAGTAIIPPLPGEIKEEFKLHYDENHPPEQYAKTPNLWRLACELSKFKNPYKTLDMVIAIAGPMLKEGGDGQQ